MQNTHSNVTVIPIRNNEFSSTNSKAISEQPAAAISIEHRPRVKAVEIDYAWKERHCRLTLRQIQVFTNLLRAVTVRLTKLFEHTEPRRKPKNRWTSSLAVFAKIGTWNPKRLFFANSATIG